MTSKKQRLFEDGIESDKNLPNPEEGKKRVQDEMNLIEGLFNWVSNLGEIFGNLFKNGIDMFKNNK